MLAAKSAASRNHITKYTSSVKKQIKRLAKQTKFFSRSGELWPLMGDSFRPLRWGMVPGQGLEPRTSFAPTASFATAKIEAWMLFSRLPRKQDQQLELSRRDLELR